MTKRHRRILDAYHRIEDTEPGISTERLFAMMANDTGADDGDICEALEAERRAKGEKIHG